MKKTAEQAQIFFNNRTFQHIISSCHPKILIPENTINLIIDQGFALA